MCYYRAFESQASLLVVYTKTAHSLGLNRCLTLPAICSQLAVRGLSREEQKCFFWVFLNTIFSAALKALSAVFIAYHCKVKVFVFPLISLQQTINSLGHKRLRTLVKKSTATSSNSDQLFLLICLNFLGSSSLVVQRRH